MSERDPKNHPKYQYWSQQVCLKNKALLAGAEDMPVNELRHQCTNYDALLNSSEFQMLAGADRVAAYHALHYEATVKPLRHREHLVSEQRNRLLEKKTTYEKAQKELRRLIKAKAIANPETVDYVQRLEKINQDLTQQSDHWKKAYEDLKVAEIELREECDRIRHDYEDALTKIKTLEKTLKSEKKHRAKLAKNNQSLGSYKGHYNRQKAKNELLKQQLQDLKGKLKQIQQYAKGQADSDLYEIAQF